MEVRVNARTDGRSKFTLAGVMYKIARTHIGWLARVYRVRLPIVSLRLTQAFG